MSENSPVRTSHLADAADALGCKVSAGGSGLRWAGRPNSSVSGRAFTLLQHAVSDREDIERPLRHPEVALTLAQPGEVIVISVEGDTKGATWGEAHAMRAFNRGVAGVLVDGHTRDGGTLCQMQMPVLYRSTSPLKSTGRIYTVGMNLDVRIDGVVVRNGDYIMLDDDGFVAISEAEQHAIYTRALEIADMEAARNTHLMG